MPQKIEAIMNRLTVLSSYVIVVIGSVGWIRPPAPAQAAQESEGAMNPAPGWSDAIGEVQQQSRQ
jgi:hypothetical protein